MTARLELIAAQMRQKYARQKHHGPAGSRHTYAAGCVCAVCKTVKRARQNETRQIHRLLAIYRKAAGEIALVESLGELVYRPISGSNPKIEFLSDNKHVHDTKGQTNAKPKSTSTPAAGKTRKAPAVAGRSSTANGSDAGRLSA